MKVLEVGEVPKKLIQFKDAWYAIAQKCEGLLQYKSGLNEEFRNSLIALEGDLSDLEELLDHIAASVQYHVRGSKDAVERSKSSMASAFKGLMSSIASDLGELKKYFELRPRLEEMVKGFEALKARHEDAKKLADRTCEQYAKAKEEHEKRIEHIEEASARELGKIRDKFISEVGPIFYGYSIRRKGRREELGLEGLFDELVHDPSYYLKIDVAQKGLRSLWKLASDIEARLVLLQYKADEVSKAMAPVLDETKRRIAKYEPEEKRIQDLGMQCNNLRDEEKNLSSRATAMERELKGLGDDLTSIKEKYGNYGRFADHLDPYIKRFSETTSPRKEFSELVDSALGMYEPIEKDIEKRELRADLRALKGEYERLVGINKNLKEELDVTGKRLSEREVEVKSLNEKFVEEKARTESLSAELKKLGDENSTLKSELSDTRRRLSDSGVKIRQLEDRVISLGEERNILKREVDESKQLLRSGGTELESMRAQMQDQTKRLVNFEEKSIILASERERLESALKTSKADLDDFRMDVQKLREEKDSLRFDLSKTAGELERITLEHQKAQSEVASLQKQLADREKRYVALKERYDKISSELAAVKKEVADLEQAMASSAAVKIKKPKAKAEREGGKKKADEEIMVGEKVGSLRPRG